MRIQQSIRIIMSSPDLRYGKILSCLLILLLWPLVSLRVYARMALRFSLIMTRYLRYGPCRLSGILSHVNFLTTDERNSGIQEINTLPSLIGSTTSTPGPNR